MILLFLTAVTTHASVIDCGPGVFLITKLGLEPSVVSPGENVTLTLLYNSPELIAGGTVENSYTFNFIKVGPTTQDLCNTVPCPIEKGSHDGSVSYQFPDLVGTLVSIVKWFDRAGNLLLCIKSSMKSVRRDKN
jgi:hypothetical protein